MIQKVSGSLVKFGSHTLDVATGVLRRGVRRRALQSQPAQLLILLVARAGELVTREEIRAQLWPDSVVDNDQNINFAIRQIRVALGSDASLVQTVPRHGYRFIGDVTDAPAKRLTIATRRSCVAAASVSVALSVGFAAGILMRNGPTGQFVYDHLVHPDRCPYIRVLLPTHRNS